LLCVFLVVMRCSGVANSVASPPVEPDIRRRAGLVLATQRHITGAGEELPSLRGRRSNSQDLWMKIV
jgi:hypothetical protein